MGKSLGKFTGLNRLEAEPDLRTKTHKHTLACHSVAKQNYKKNSPQLYTIMQHIFFKSYHLLQA